MSNSNATMKSGPGETKVIGLVRDEHGHPVFDDYNNIDPLFRQVFTAEDWRYIKQKQRKQNG